MKLALQADRPTIVVGTCLGLVALLVLYCIVHFWLVRMEYVREIESIQPRTSRLLGMMESQRALDVASGIAASMLRDLAYAPGRDSANVAATMQQDVRETMADAGLSVRGSQILTVRTADGFDRLPLDITVEGDIVALEEALSSLESMRPLVFVESLKIKPARTRTPRGGGSGDPRTLNARFTLFSLRLHR